MLKKIGMFIFAFALFLPVLLTGNSASASSNLDEKIELKEDFIQSLKKTNPSSTEEIELVLKNVIEKYPQQKNLKVAPLPNLSKEDIKNNTVDLNNYVQKNIKENVFQEEKINDNVSIIFTNDDVFFVSIFEEKESKFTKNNVKDLNLASPAAAVASSLKFTGTKSHKYVGYSWTGAALWEIYVEGEFAYNGSSVTPYFYDGYVDKKFAGFIWQVDNFIAGSTQKADKKSATVYSQANVHYGLEYSGVGIVVQYLTLKVYIQSDHNGNVYGYTDIRD